MGARIKPLTTSMLAIALIAVAWASSTVTADHEDDEIIVAVLDSGIRPTHNTFDPGQVVAWRDFVNGEPSPYDDHGHGTAVASMVAGTQDSRQTPSHAPGAKLAVGKVLSANNGAWWTDVEAGIYWAVDDVGADVITISIYAYDHRPTFGPLSGWHWSAEAMLDAIEYAHDHGTFVTILAGNGMFNAGLPTMSYLHPPATSQHALIVGGAYDDGVPRAPLSSMEPEVTAPYFVRVACEWHDNCYKDWQGTSFSTPLVAGMAATLLDQAKAQGDSLTPPMLEDLLEHAAEDTPAPPTLEGYGFLDAAALQRASDGFADGSWTDQGPTGVVNDVYMDQVQDRSRATWDEANR